MVQAWGLKSQDSKLSRSRNQRDRRNSGDKENEDKSNVGLRLGKLSTKEVVGGDAVVVPNLHHQHSWLPELSLLQSKGSGLAPDAHLPLRRQVVKAKHEAPIEVALSSQGVEVDVCLLFVMLQPLYPAA